MSPRKIPWVKLSLELYNVLAIWLFRWMSLRSFIEVESENLKICKKKKEEERLEVQQQI